MNISEILPSFFQKELFGNTLENIFSAIIVFILFLIVIRFFRTVILKKLGSFAQKTQNNIDLAIVNAVSRISREFFWLLALFFTVNVFLSIEGDYMVLLKNIVLVFMAFEIIKILQKVIYYLLTKSSLGKNKTSLQGIKFIINFSIWALGILVVLSNLGFNINALIASLGIGGIAIALATQNLLGDLFSSFTIFFDKPFQVGDFVIIGNESGTVKNIGLKTTRITTIQGEELVISNKKLTESDIRNYGKMEKRRVDFTIGVTYDTPTEKLKKIPKIVKKSVQKHKDVKFIRCFFHELANYSLNFDVAFIVLTSDYDEYSKLHEKVNLSLMEDFATEKIEFAFPTQVIYTNKIK